MLNYSFRT
uniref:Uncharacterized protein n=1 Tax=Anguilla anguilla TaxID=7936 RepID=A0A0E9TKL9_ANGAN